MSAAPNTGRLAGRLALVTGASRGLGAAIAKRFAAEGAHVVILARTVGGLEEVDDEIRAAGSDEATLVPMDLTESEKIDQLGAALYERFGRLDILVGNAGYLGPLSPAGHIDPTEWQRVIDTNLTANWRLIRALDPLLRMSAAGRGIFVTCAQAQGVFPYWGAYATSKAGLETLVRTYAGEITKTPVRVNLIDPGILRTRLRAAAFPGEDPQKQTPPEAVTDIFVDLADAECQRHGETVRLG